MLLEPGVTRPCQERAGFLFPHRCEAEAVVRCDVTGAALCRTHAFEVEWAALAAVQLLTPVGSRVLGLAGLRAPGAAGQPAIVAAVLMLGWSVVLVWAHLRTRERRAVLAITLAVVLALAAGNLALGATGAMAWSVLAPTLGIQAVLTALFATSVAIARKAALERDRAATASAITAVNA